MSTCPQKERTTLFPLSEGGCKLCFWYEHSICFQIFLFQTPQLNPTDEKKNIHQPQALNIRKKNRCFFVGLFFVASFSGSISQNFKVPSMTISDLVAANSWESQPPSSSSREATTYLCSLKFRKVPEFVGEKLCEKHWFLSLKQGGDINTLNTVSQNALGAFGMYEAMGGSS